LNIAFGWGEENGYAIQGDAVGKSSSNYINTKYSTIYNAINGLPKKDPTSGGTFYVSNAEAKALGLQPSVNPIDGYIGLNSSDSFSFDPSNRAVNGDYDAIGVLEHEISEVMGRVGALGMTGANGEQNWHGWYTPLDLFRYASPGVRDLTPGPGYFSVTAKHYHRCNTMILQMEEMRPIGCQAS
jgi:hypothetical protein